MAKNPQHGPRPSWLVGLALLAVALVLWVRGTGGLREAVADGDRLAALSAPARDQEGRSGEQASTRWSLPQAPREGAVLVRVVEEDDMPITGARVRYGTDLELQGLTDGVGEIELVLGESSLDVEVSAEGFHPRRVKLSPQAARVTVHLASQANLRGVVVDPGGAPIPFARILARPAASVPRVEFVLGDGGEDWHRTTTSEAGEFQMRGLVPGRVYVLGAGATGWVLPKAVVFSAGAATQKESTVITLAYAFGLHLRLTDADGGPPVTSPNLFGFGPEFMVPYNDVGTLPDQVSSMLAGAPPSLVGTVRRDERLLLWFSTTDHGQLRTRLRVRVPGYDLVDEDVFVPRLRSTIDGQDVVLRAIPGACFGELKIRVGSSAPRGEVERDWHASPLRGVLRPPTASGTAISFLVELDDQGEMVLDLVPCGPHVLTVNAPHGRMEAVAQDVEIRPGGGAEAFFDISELAELRVRLFEADGTEYRGMVHFHFYDPGDSARTSWTFQEGPYLLRHMEPGTLDLGVQFPFEPDARPARATLTLVSGGVATISWPIDGPDAPVVIERMGDRGESRASSEAPEDR